MAAPSASTASPASHPPGLYLIGLGLGDALDVTLRGSAAIAACSTIWLESYTSILGEDASPEALAARYGKPVRVAWRETVESEAESILGPAAVSPVAFLVVGDPFGATTHSDLVLRARAAGVRVTVIHNASIMNAAGAAGLQLYNFGATVSIPFFRGSWRPSSFYPRIAHNAAGGLHTLCLLDIKVREPDYDVLTRTGRTVFEPPRFMSVAQAAAQLLEVEKEKGEGVCGPDTRAIGLARVGGATQLIVSGTLGELATADLGPPLHSLILVGGPLHDLEQAMYDEALLPPGFPTCVPLVE